MDHGSQARAGPHDEDVRGLAGLSKRERALRERSDGLAKLGDALEPLLGFFFRVFFLVSFSLFFSSLFSLSLFFLFFFSILINELRSV